LGGQLVFTAAIVYLFGHIPSWTRWMRTAGTLGPVVPILSLLISTAAWFFMSASVDARRRGPLKWQLLAIFTAGEACSVGFLSSLYTWQSVVQSMLATAAATAGISIYTLTNPNPRYDLSQWGSAISSCGMILLAYGFVHLLELLGVLPHGFLPYHDVLYSLGAACLFSFYLAYHTRLIVAYVWPLLVSFFGRGALAETVRILSHTRVFPKTL
jgi:hypothetical protein